MLNRSLLVIVGPLGVALFLSVNLFAQNSSTQTWPDPVVLRPPVAEEDKKPALRRSLAGMWGSREGNQAKGVQLRPNLGTTDELPYTPHGLELYESYKPMEGVPPRAVPPAETNDPRARCEPLGFPDTITTISGCKSFRTSTKSRFSIVTTTGGASSGLTVDRSPHWSMAAWKSTASTGHRGG